MKQKFNPREWISIQIAKNPRGMILLAILLLNVIFIFVGAVVISHLAPESLEYDGFWACVFYTIIMVLDAGSLQFVIADVGHASVAVIIACLVIVLIGMITFMGAVIGYVTSYISSFITAANTGSRRLNIEGHTVILNWNSRASEIVNDLLFSETREKIVILVPENKETVEKEIEDRLLDTMEKERRYIREATRGMGAVAAWAYAKRHNLRDRMTVIVREGDTFSTKKLNDIAIKRAKTIVILGKDIQNATNRFEYLDRLENFERGNSNTVKTLIQVADMTSAEDSLNKQKVVVEVDDNWTLHLVNRIIAHKERQGKCNIIPVPVNQILGQILSQFSIMPELNTVYGELFSNKGAAFFSEPVSEMMDDNVYCPDYMKHHTNAIPLTCMEEHGQIEQYYLATCHSDLTAKSTRELKGIDVKVNGDYWLKKRNVIILGHNSKSAAIMEGFDSFRGEWNFCDEKRIAENGGPEILNIAVVDDAKSLDRMNRYRDYPYVNEIIEADVYDREAIIDSINRIVDANTGDTSILILSDDMVLSDEFDANALTYLIYVQDIITARLEADPNFDIESIDVIVEILNPKHFDIVRSYSINNIVISNRYISKMITQIGEKEAIYNFYHDILTYDEETGTEYASKELYAKEVADFFTEVPGRCKVSELIRGVYDATPPENKAVILGYVRKGGELVIFSGDQTQREVELRADDKLIMFCNH